jgi:tripartite-type tricarboxylate transporter receptor subunit TctC
VLMGMGATAVGALAIRPALSQAAYPTQSIKFIIPAGAGGLPDTVARMMGRRLQEKVGQSVVVENKPGGNGAVSVAALMTSPPDGTEFIIQDGSIYAINPHIYAKMAYSISDLIPTTMIAQAPLFLAVHQKVPVKTMNELIAYAKANPGKLNYGSSGVGSTHHLSMEALTSSLGLVMTHIPFKGTSESVPALLGGHVDLAFSAYPSLSGAVGTKNITLLATNGAKRSAMAPDVPPVADWIPGYNFAPVVGVFARIGTPPAIMQKIASEVAAIVKEPEIIKQFETAGIEPLSGGPAEYAEELKGEDERVAKTVKAAGMKPQ